MGAIALPAIAKLENAIVAHLLSRLAQTDPLDEPFPHFYLERIFPDDVFAELVDELPSVECYARMGTRHTLEDGTCTRFELLLSEASLAKLSPIQRELWGGVRAGLASIEVKRAVFRKLRAGLSCRFGVPPDQVGRIEGYPRIALMRETKGYYIAPHTDTRKKVVTMQIALPRDRSQLGLGTALYRRSLAPKDLVSMPRGFRTVKTFPFAPNSGYAFSVLNQVGKKSWHGCEVLGETAGIRHSLLNNYYVKFEQTATYYIKGGLTRVRDTIRNHLWILLAAGVVFFTNLGVPALWDDDESKNAECAREMLERGDWTVPVFNYDLRTDKPVLIYWFMIVAYEMFGVTEFAARFWSAVLAVGTCLMTYHLGRLLFRPAVGLWGGLILSSALMFDIAGRAATPDSMLIFFATLAMLSFVVFVQRRQETGREVRPRDYVPVYAAMGLAVLVKGPVGVLLPALVMIVYLRCRAEAGAAASLVPDTRSWPRQFAAWLRHCAAGRPWINAFRAMRPLTAIVVVAAVALPWYLWVGICTNGHWLTGFLGRHNMQRFLQPLENHRGPFFYYVIAILFGFLPWSVFLPQAVLRLGRRIAAQRAWQPGDALVACWAGVYLVFFSLAATKLPSYVLPAYPALALMTAALIDQWLTAPDSVPYRWLHEALTGLLVVGVVMLIGLPIVMHVLVNDAHWLGLIGVAPVVGAVAAWCLWQQGRLRVAAATVTVSAVIMVTALFGAGAVRLSNHHNGPALANALKHMGRDDAPLATFGYNAPSLSFYTQARVDNLTTVIEVTRHFARSNDACLITKSELLADLQPLLPDDVRVLIRQHRFLKRGDLVVLGRELGAADAVAKD